MKKNSGLEVNSFEDLNARQIGAIQSWIYLAAVTSVAVTLRISGLNPDSLWLDDAWQAVLSNTALHTQLEFSSSAPLGFTALIGFAANLISDLELGYQLPVFIISILQIPLFFVFLQRVTQSRVLALWGASFCCISNPLILYSTRIKQYTLDAFLVTAVLILFHSLWKNSIRLLPVTVSCALASIFSFTVLIVTTLFLNIFLLREIIQNKCNWPDIRTTVYCVFCYNLTVVTFYLAILKQQNSHALNTYWENYFIPLDKGAWICFQAIIEHFPDIIISAFPRGLLGFIPFDSWKFSNLFIIAIIIITILLAMRNFIIRYGMDVYWCYAILSVYAGMIILSGLKIYPLGGGRTDIFTFPITFLIFLSSFGGIGERLKPSVNTYLPQVTALLFLIIFGIPSLREKTMSYPMTGNTSQLIDIVEEKINTQDVLIIYPHGNFVYGHYTKMPTKLRKTKNYGTGFEVVVDRPNVHVLPGILGYRQNPILLKPALNVALSKAPGRVFFFGNHISTVPVNFITKSILERGYLTKFSKNDNGSALMIFSISPK